MAEYVIQIEWGNHDPYAIVAELAKTLGADLVHSTGNTYVAYDQPDEPPVEIVSKLATRFGNATFKVKGSSGGDELECHWGIWAKGFERECVWYELRIPFQCIEAAEDDFWREQFVPM